MDSTNQGCACDCNETELLERLEAILGDQKDRPGALIPALQAAQNLFGYLPEVALRRISSFFGKSYSEVAGIVGFYSFFSTTPRGKYLIRVCLGTACYVRGGRQILQAFRNHLGIEVGGTTEDRLFSLDIARCFGACGLAPVIMINDDVHQRVKPTDVPGIIALYLEKERVAETTEATAI